MQVILFGCTTCIYAALDYAWSRRGLYSLGGAHALAVGGAYFDQPISARVTIFICTLIKQEIVDNLLILQWSSDIIDLSD